MNISPALFRISDLPQELRTHILSFLLPDLPVIDHDSGYSPCANGAPRHSDPADWYIEDQRSCHNFRSDNKFCCIGLLLASRQLYEDGLRYLYRQKTFKFTVYDFGFDYLNKSSQLHRLPQLPYHQMKEFVIQVVEVRDLCETGYRIRENLVWLCSLLRQHNVRFKKLRIELEVCGENSWPTAPYDSTVSEVPAAPDYTHQIDWELPDVNFVAHRLGFPSTFAYMIKPLALLPKADECTIELPHSLKDKQHLVDLAKHYEAIIASGAAAENEDHACMQQDEAWFAYKLKHIDGPMRECDCRGCVEWFEATDYLEKVRVKRAKEWARYEAEWTQRVQRGGE